MPDDRHRATGRLAFFFSYLQYGHTPFQRRPRCLRYCGRHGCRLRDARHARRRLCRQLVCATRNNRQDVRERLRLSHDRGLPWLVVARLALARPAGDANPRVCDRAPPPNHGWRGRLPARGVGADAVAARARPLRNLRVHAQGLCPLPRRHRGRLPRPPPHHHRRLHSLPPPPRRRRAHHSQRRAGLPLGPAPALPTHRRGDTLAAGARFRSWLNAAPLPAARRR